MAPPVPPPFVALAVSPGTCQSATNTYTLTGTLSLTNATAASLTIADGGATTTLAITAGQAQASFSLTGLLAGSGNHTVSVTGAGYTPTSATYSAPASCSWLHQCHHQVWPWPYRPVPVRVPPTPTP